MRRPRVTIRRLLVLVCLSGLGIWAWHDHCLRAWGLHRLGKDEQAWAEVIQAMPSPRAEALLRDVTLALAQDPAVDIRRRLAAAETLALVAPEDAIQPLVNLFEQEDCPDEIRNRAVERLGCLGPSAVPALRRHALQPADHEHPPQQVVNQSSSLTALASIGAAATPTFAEVLFQPTDCEICRRAQEWLLDCIRRDQVPAPPVPAELATIVVGDQGRIDTYRLELLLTLGASVAELPDALTTGALTEDPWARAARGAARILVDPADPGAVTLLLAPLPVVSEQDSLPAWWTLAMQRVPGPVSQHLAELLPDASMAQLEDLIGVLVTLGPEAAPAVPALIDVLRSNPHPPASAITALGEIGPGARAATPQLIELLDDPRLWRAAARALGQIDADPGTVVPVLNEMIRQHWSVPSGLAFQPDLRALQYLDTLSRFGSEARTAVPLLLEVLQTGTSRDAAHAIRLLVATGGGDPEVQRALLTTLEHPVNYLKYTALLALIDLAPQQPEVRAALRETLQDPDDWPGPWVMEHLPVLGEPPPRAWIVALLELLRTAEIYPRGLPWQTLEETPGWRAGRAAGD